MEGLTYETRSQADTAVEDYRNQGLLAKAIRTREGKWRVLLVISSTPEVEKELGETKLEEKGEKREFEKEERKEAWREARYLPKEIKKRKLEAKHKQLERENGRRVRLGMEKGTILEVRNPETYEVIDYKLVLRGIEQKAVETISKKIPEEISKLPATATGFTGGVVASTSRQINVRRGMKASIPGQAPTPRAVIAALPTRDIGAIGVARPAIGKIGKPGVEEANALGVKARGFGTPPSELPLKTIPKAKPISANGFGDVGFARMPRLKKSKEKTEEEI